MDVATWYRVGVKAVVVQGDSVLLVKEGSDSWDFPGGGLEHNETIAQGLARECREELGLDIATHDPAPCFVGKSYDPVNLRDVVALYFITTLRPGRPRTSKEVPVIGYEQIDALRAEQFDPYIRPYWTELQAVLKQIGEKPSATIT